MPGLSRRLWYSCLNPKWQRVWMWVSLLVLGPTFFMVGLGTGRRVGTGKTKVSSAAQTSNGSSNPTTTIKSNQVFLKHNEILRSSDPSRCVQPDGGDDSKGEGSYIVCLSLQSNGNLLLFQQQQQRSTVLWKSQVTLSPGDFWTRLQGDGNLVTTRGTGSTTADASLIVWDSRSASLDNTEYYLIWDTAEKGMQIVRLQEEDNANQNQQQQQQPIVLWSTTSTWGSEEEGLDWQPVPIGDESMPIEPMMPTTEASMPIAAPSPAVTTPPPPQQSELGATPKAWFSAPASNQFVMRSGPMVGHTTDRTVRLWALQGQNQVMELAYRQVSGNDASNMGYSLAMPPNADQGAAILEVTNLQPDTQYEYQVRIQGETVGEGIWKTATPLSQPARFQFLLASCMDVKGNRHPRQPVWDKVLEQGQPDFAILNGDTVYLNDGDWTANKEIILERVWARNLAQRDESHFQNFISKVPMYGK
jgi:hypothetical protein